MIKQQKDNKSQTQLSSTPAADIIGITMGCPVGIGPEIIIRFLSAYKQQPDRFLPIVIGDKTVLTYVSRKLQVDIKIVAWQPGQKVIANAINVLSLSELGDELSWGKPDQQTGKAMGSYIEKAVQLIKQGHLAAMTTCPITKTALQAAGYDFPGHTEMIASLINSNDYAMMMAGHRLRVTLVTIHSRLTEAVAAITKDSVNRMIKITDQALRKDFGINKPRIAVAALNPHAGEGGIFGDEEARLIAPAICAAGKHGYHAVGPFPPDTVFVKAAADEFDAVVCMYHDQGLIPFKLLHFADGVNVTIGLPIVRTSVDHGTAYDIAGKGLASSTSLKAAFKMAGQIVINRRQYNHEKIL